MKIDNMGAPQKQCYNKSMRLLEDVFWSLCNANGPLPSVVEQGKVIRIIQETRDKINALIKRK